MGLVLFHVTDSANRESIRQHGLDWRRMSTVLGIAGSRVPEYEGIFLARSEGEAKFFVEMTRSNSRRADVWEVSLDLDLDVDLDDDLPEDLSPNIPLKQHRDGFLYYSEPIPPSRLNLIEPETLRDL